MSNKPLVGRIRFLSGNWVVVYNAAQIGNETKALTHCNNWKEIPIITKQSKNLHLTGKRPNGMWKIDNKDVKFNIIQENCKEYAKLIQEVTEENLTLNSLYKIWCEETKRGGAILVGGSIREFFNWVEKEYSIVKIKQ